MTANLTESLAKKILDHVPDNVKPIDYLMQTLSLGKDSAYRRVRGEVPFTFEEIIKLSVQLGFSVDDLIQSKKNNIHEPFFMQSDNLMSVHDSFKLMLEKYRDYLLRDQNSKKVEVCLSANQILPISVIFYPTLLKFYYFKWMHQKYDVSLNLNMSEVTVSDEIIKLCDEIRAIPECKGANYIYIIDSSSFINTINEVRYYNKRNLITKEELAALKDDLSLLIDGIEGMARRGPNELGLNFQLYLSLLNIPTNSIYFSSDNFVESSFWIYSANPIVTYHPESCAIHRKWLSSIQKYAVPVSEQNGAVLSDYFSNQHQLLENIAY